MIGAEETTMIAYLMRSAICFASTAAAPVRTHGLIADQNASKDNLQWLQTFASDINQCVKVGIPLSYCRPQGDNSDNGFGKWKDNFEEEAKISASIQLRRLPEILRDTVVEERSSYDDVIRYNGERNNHNPEGIQQMKSLYCQVGRDQTTGEEHRDQIKCREKSSSI